MTFSFGGKSYTLEQQVEYAVPALDHLWYERIHTCIRCGAAEPAHDGVTYDGEPGALAVLCVRRRRRQ